jgi:hypothetical protein
MVRRMRDLENSVGSFTARKRIRIEAYPYRFLIAHLNSVPEENALDELIDLANRALVAGLVNTMAVGQPLAVAPLPLIRSTSPPSSPIENQKVSAPIEEKMSSESIKNAFAKPTRK